MAAYDGSFTVLLVDDDPDDKLLVEEAIEEASLPYALRWVRDGEELLDYLNQRGDYAAEGDAPWPDLIMLDLNMPRKSGSEVLGDLKSDPKTRRIPVVVYTTTWAEDEIARCYDQGANTFVIKPVSFEGLVGMMQTLTRYWFHFAALPPRG